jgi:hypothetical protein
MKMAQTECFETSENKIQTPGNYPEETVQLKIVRLLSAGFHAIIYGKIFCF